jgi:agmatine deiminase
MKSVKYIISIIIIFLFIPFELFTQTILQPRAMAEWEELQAISIAWNDFSYSPFSQTPLTKAVRKAEMKTLAEITRAALNEGLQVYILDTLNGNSLIDLDSFGIASPDVQVLEFNKGSYWVDVWQRDRGPMSVYANGVDSINFVYWADNTSAALLAGFMNISFINNGVLNYPYTDGGNYMTDGHGRVFSDERTLNPAQFPAIRNAYLNNMGISEIFNLPPYRVHVDYYMKLIDEETILVSDIPYSNYDPDVDYYLQHNQDIQAAIDYISQNYVSCYGHPYKFVRITNAPTINEFSLNLTAFTADLSYVNSLILNKTVVIPSYDSLVFGQKAGYEQFDESARQIYKQQMPGYNIVSVPSMFFGQRGGTVHCITKEIGVNEPLLITHKWMPDTVYNDGSGYEIMARARTRSGIQQVTLHWGSDPWAGLQELPMPPVGNDSFSVIIPEQTGGTEIFYYISARSNSGRMVNKPLVAPQGLWSFRVLEPAGIAGYRDKKVKTFVLEQNYPNPFNPKTIIRYTLAERTPVTIKIFDINGREVKTLVRETFAAGEYSVTWDGANDQGIPISSGVYLYRIQAGNYTESKKMILMR